MDLNKIYVGDTLGILNTFPDNSIDIIITSPPYNKNKAKGKLVKEVVYNNYNDFIPELEYQFNQIKVLDELYRISKPHGHIFYNHKLRWVDGIMIHPMEWLFKMKWNIRQEIIWNRSIAGNIRPWRFWQIDERIYWMQKGITKGEELKSKHAKMTSIWKIFPENKMKEHPCCVDEKTECLTNNGWKNYNNLSLNDKLLSFNIEKNYLEWSSIKTIHKYRYDGNMVSVNGRHLNFCVTPDHRCLVFDKKDNLIKYVPSSLLIPRNMLIPSSVKNYKNDVYECPINELESRFLGWFLSEGHFLIYKRNEKKSICGFVISQSLDVNEKFVQEIEDVIQKLKITYSKTIRKKKYIHNNNHCYKTLVEFFIYKKKNMWFVNKMIDFLNGSKLIPQKMISYPRNIIENFIDSFYKGDGRKVRFNIKQKSEHNLDILSAFAIILGYDVCLYNPDMSVNLTQKRYKLLRNSKGSILKNIHYNGIVWCPELEVNGNFFARRNGKIHITGNSFPIELPTRCIYSIADEQNGLTVLDPYCGIGSTLVAAKALKHNYIGIDCSQEYVDVANQRLEKMNEIERVMDEVGKHCVEKSYAERKIKTIL